MDIGIVYFSGTGNTEILAEEIHDSMESQEHRARLMEMEEILQGRSGFHPADYRIIGIGFPVHGMNPARIALDFIHSMPDSGFRQPVFLFATAGEISRGNNQALGVAAHRLAAKGYRVLDGRYWFISSNWHSEYDEKRIRRAFPGILTEVKEWTKELLILAEEEPKGEEKGARRPNLPEPGACSAMGRSLLNLIPLWGRFFRAGPGCTSCGLCVSRCPKENIKMNGSGDLVFGRRCTFCLRCAYSCPNRAISFPGSGRILVKGKYDIRETLQDLHCRPYAASARQQPEDTRL
ncbi:MAG: EFR1 family ferrodoxin [Peptococcaceae bacterium]|nr:EFR1 family ferrodoxin [Peptococcaceae bacterium]